jgi:hypothetical protein
MAVVGASVAQLKNYGMFLYDLQFWEMIEILRVWVYR